MPGLRVVLEADQAQCSRFVEAAGVVVLQRQELFDDELCQRRVVGIGDGNPDRQFAVAAADTAFDDAAVVEQVDGAFSGFQLVSSFPE